MSPPDDDRRRDAAAPLDLRTGPDLWEVQAGAVDLFAVPLTGGRPGARLPLFRVEAGQAFFGLPDLGALAGEVGVVGVAVPDTELARRTDPWAAAEDASGDRNHLLDRLGRWLTAIRRWMARDAELHGDAESLPAALSSEALSQLDAMSARAALEAHARAWLPRLERALGEDRAQRTERLHRKEAEERGALRGGLARMAAVLPSQGGPDLGEAAEGAEADPLRAACVLVLEASGVPRPTLKSDPEAIAEGRAVEVFARQAGVFHRAVELDRPRWWREDNGPLLAFEGEDHRPVALLPRNDHSYLRVDPATGEEGPLTAERARALQRSAFTFFPAFPEKKVGLRDLLRLGLQGVRADLRRVLIFGALAGALGLFTPFATGQLVERIIPGQRIHELYQLVLLLVTAAFSVSAFDLLRSVAMLRIDGRMDVASQSAVLHRLLHLPASFFRRFSAGDLAQRAFGISGILKTISTTTQSAVLSWIFALFSYAYLFFIHVPLALLATGLVAVLLGITFVVNVIQVRYERDMINLEGRLSSLVLQLLQGIAKLRAAGAERSGFGRWAGSFAEQNRLNYQARRLTNFLTSLDAAYAVLNSILIFALVAYFVPDLPTGKFVAFNSAFAQFFAATTGVVTALASSLRIIPLYERSQPIFEAVPEREQAAASPGTLQGKIEISHVAFRYDEEGGDILRDVTLRAEPGEFVAIVGPSGSGKSTLFRLLLGFEQPRQGAVYYDDRDLSKLDLAAVRSQLGVVLQNGQLMFGDIFTNIIGSKNLTLDDAWEAAKRAGMQEDIEAMPMGMHTMLAEGASTISGGQRQRLMIARAIVSKPRILLFDEATSALDNRTQSIVSRSVEQLEATRIVIAHRLSTIEKADRIYVVDKGSVVESGTYRELLDRKGTFAELARRQMA